MAAANMTEAKVAKIAVKRMVSKKVKSREDKRRSRLQVEVCNRWRMLEFSTCFYMAKCCLSRDGKHCSDVLVQNVQRLSGIVMFLLNYKPGYYVFEVRLFCHVLALESARALFSLLPEERAAAEWLNYL